MSRYSYSALNMFDTCPYSFYQKYVQFNVSQTQTLAIEMGNLLHKVLEVASRFRMEDITPDMRVLQEILQEGWQGEGKSGIAETLPGVAELKEKYFEEWRLPDKSNRTFDDKLPVFWQHVEEVLNEREWIPIAVEFRFQVDFNDTQLFGIVDHVAMNQCEQLRITDYKSSASVYRPEKLTTPLQLYIYALAVADAFPDAALTTCEYDFVLLNQKQSLDVGGWMKRAEKKLTRIIDSIAESNRSGVWRPKPTPLCYWCPYCKTNPQADMATKHLCRWHSLWSPNRKVYDTASKWTEDQATSTPFVF